MSGDRMITEERSCMLQLVGQAVRRRRLELALTQRDLARISGLDPSSISYLERGTRHARVSTIQRLARALRCGPMDIAQIVEDQEGGDEGPA